MNRAVYRPRPYHKAVIPAHVEELEAAGRRAKGSPLVESLMAVCPNGGKTYMAIDIMERMIKRGTAKRVLVLAHGMKLLRTQFVDALEKAQPDFTFSECIKGVDITKLREQVIVALPHSIHQKDFKGFDLVVVDEAHEFYSKPMTLAILRKCGAGRVLLLTGTPEPFIARGLKPTSVVALADLYDGGYTADPVVDVARSAYNIKNENYNAADEVRGDTKTTKRQTIKTLDSLLDALAKRLSIAGTNGARWGKTLAKLRKTMIVCRSTKIAKQVRDYFEAKKIGVVISTSETDDEQRGTSNAIRRFENEDPITLLVVVRRGNLGYNFPRLVNLVDMTGTRNVSRIFQMLCRVVREYPKERPEAKSVQKVFIKLASKDMAEYTVSLMDGVMSLADREVFSAYDGNAMGLRVPTPKKSGSGGEGPERKDGEPRLHTGGLLFGDFFKRVHEDITIARTTLGRVRCELLGRGFNVAANKKRYLSEFQKTGNWPKIGTNDYNNHAGYARSDLIYGAKCRALGWGRETKMLANKARYLADFYKTGSWPEPHSKDRIQHIEYVTRDPIYAAKCRALGWGRQVEVNKERFLANKRKTGKWPEQRAEYALHKTYCLRDPIYASKCRAMGWIQNAPKVRAAANKKFYIAERKKTGKWPSSHSKEYSRIKRYMFTDPVFAEQCHALDWGNKRKISAHKRNYLAEGRNSKWPSRDNKDFERFRWYLRTDPVFAKQCHKRGWGRK